MFITLAMMSALAFSYPLSSTPSNYQPFEDVNINGLEIDLSVVPFTSVAGSESVLISCLDTDTGIRTNLFNITFNQYNTE